MSESTETRSDMGTVMDWRGLKRCEDIDSNRAYGTERKDMGENATETQ
jgi:hypothetical protein